MGDLNWTQRGGLFTWPLDSLRYHAVALGGSGTGKTETLQKIAYGGRKGYNLQVIYLDAKGETKREDEEGQDNAAKFVATMHAAGADNIKVFPSLHYNGWQGSPVELKNRLLSVIDLSESAYYGDVAANVVGLALAAPKTPRSSAHFLANLRQDRLKQIYANDRQQLQRVYDLDKDLLKQVEMRYQVFFDAMAGQLDGTLDYVDADAVYLRVRGFALRNEAPRLGRFLIHDFMHYVSERRRPGIVTLFIVDELNALRSREETSMLFEQARSFGGCLLISAQGYAGLGPTEYANRILDACSTYIVHRCSDPFEIVKRAGKHWKLDRSWSEDQEGIARQHMRPIRDWKVPVDAVLRQGTGQAYWIYAGRAQQTQTVQVPITQEQIMDAWQEIRQQEDVQRTLSEVEAQRQQARTQNHQPPQPGRAGGTATATTTKPAPGKQQSKQSRRTIQNQTPDPQAQTKPTPAPPKSTPSQAPPKPRVIPTPDSDDDEPDRL